MAKCKSHEMPKIKAILRYFLQAEVSVLRTLKIALSDAIVVDHRG